MPASEIDLILNKMTPSNNKTVLSILSVHRPVIKHGGDQRDPTEEISCACQAKSSGYSYESLNQPYYLHLFDVMMPSIVSIINDTGR